jgi:hypothetical protein
MVRRRVTCDGMGNCVDNVEARVIYSWCSDSKGRKIYNVQFSGIGKQIACLMYAGKTLLMSNGGTSSVMGEE